MKKLGTVTLDQNEIGRVRSLRIEVIRSAKSWFNSGTNDVFHHNVKVDVLANSQAISYFSFFVAPPELDCAYYDSAGQKDCNPKVECCLVPYYVNFTEIGWNKFILYPDGFYANYCIGPKLVSCPHEDPDIEGILK
ncbi:hypothetical protein OESDEN_01674 [Oesophagostomum dentatum]|uniref:TGF-beta family profile domain-containing protein n=1 Tax=Oesophagostomum dentatum TaxID=61180 RepID=A0A0B1TLA3_OESDE|nr:hypothetical protein OESDEN_01674 [Oesophagostomum dentatum]